MSKGRIIRTAKWFVLLGSVEDGDYFYTISHWDHMPNQQELDSAVDQFSDEELSNYYLVEEIARGVESLRLNFHKASKAA